MGNGARDLCVCCFSRRLGGSQIRKLASFGDILDIQRLLLLIRGIFQPGWRPRRARWCRSHRLITHKCTLCECCQTIIMVPGTVYCQCMLSKRSHWSTKSDRSYSLGRLFLALSQPQDFFHTGTKSANAECRYSLFCAQCSCPSLHMHPIHIESSH